MTSAAEGIIDVLRDAILRYGVSYPQHVRRYVRGEPVIRQGSISDVCYLIKSGTVSVLVRDISAGTEAEVALRYAREFIGETAFLQRGVPRTASVVVYSPEAELIAITRSDLYALLSQEPGLHDAIAMLWELSAARRRETLAVLGGHITVRTEIKSALLADIHNFSSLGEVVWEEEMDAFLFDFIESSSDIAQVHAGQFEDQGDGFKVLFGGPSHANRAVLCAIAIQDRFRELRASRATDSASFRKIGLGIGVCTDFMSERRRDGSRQPNGRVLSHALNVAAAISKYRESVDETEIYVDEMTMKLVREPSVQFRDRVDITLEKLGRRQPVYAAIGSSARVDSEGLVSPESPEVGRAFISYARADTAFVDTLVRRLEHDGVTIWRDSTQILVGDDIDRAISKGIQSNRLFLIVLTPNSIKSDWVSRELEEASHEAVSGEKVLLPVLTGGLDTKDLPPRLRRKKSVAFNGDFDAPYALLLESIREHTRRSRLR